MKLSSSEFRRFRRIFIGVFIFIVVMMLVSRDWKNAFLFVPLLILIYGPIYFIPCVLIPWITKQITRKMVRTSHSTSPIDTANVKKNDYRTNMGKVMALISIILLAAIAVFFVFPGKLGITLSSVLSIVWLIAFIAAITAFNTAKTEKTKLVAEKEGMTFQENGDYLFPLLEEFQLLSFGKKSLKNFSNVSQKKINDIEVTIFDYQYGWYTPGARRDHGPPYTYSDHYDIREQTVIFFQGEKLNIPDFFLCPKKISYKISRKSGFKKINLDTAPLFSQLYLLFGKDEEAIGRVFKKELLYFYEDHRGLTSEGSKNKLICYRPDELVKPEVFPSFLEEGSRLFEILTKNTLTVP
ncbi:MAG: hypothetical protein PVH61_27525 [Candidatus Aminicenantes bacterium]|jgi:hypothetical protein